MANKKPLRIIKPEENTLDPESWDDFGTFAHQALDEALSYVSGVKERPPWKPVSDKAKDSFQQSLPNYGTPVEAVFERVDGVPGRRVPLAQPLEGRGRLTADNRRGLVDQRVILQGGHHEQQYYQP